MLDWHSCQFFFFFFNKVNIIIIIIIIIIISGCKLLSRGKTFPEETKIPKLFSNALLLKQLL